MPTYIRPARVDVTEDGSGGLVLIAAGALAVAAVVAFVLAHLALLAAAAAVFAAVMGAVLAWFRWLASPRRLQERHRGQRATVTPAKPVRAIPARRPKAIESRRAVAGSSPDVNRVRIPRVR